MLWAISCLVVLSPVLAEQTPPRARHEEGARPVEVEPRRRSIGSIQASLVVEHGHLLGQGGGDLLLDRREVVDPHSGRRCEEGLVKSAALLSARHL
jgi:hypothetical protein